MEHIFGSQLTPEHGRAFLSAIIRQERATIAQLAMLSRVDGLYSTTNARHEVAAADMWTVEAQEAATEPKIIPSLITLSLRGHINNLEDTSGLCSANVVRSADDNRNLSFCSV